MRYEVVVTASAQRELEQAYSWLLAQTPQHAPLWYNGALDALFSLEQNPTRCPIVPESDAAGEMRQLLYGSKAHVYRILFSVRGEKVVILHIIHAARQAP
jgi:plasmid stabilization system protein ParE